MGKLPGMLGGGHRFLRFVLTGLVNTAVGYGLFLLALLALPTTTMALAVSTILAVLFNFLSTGAFVFGNRDPKRILPFLGVQLGLFAYAAMLLRWLEGLGVSPQIGGLLILPTVIAISYCLNAKLVFRATA